MNKNSIIILLILVITLTSCKSVKEGLSGRKQNNSDEFLVQKKSPLVVPPDFEKMPIPKDEIVESSSKKFENSQDSDFKKLLKTQDQNIDISDSIENTGNIEKKIIDKIK